MLTCCISITCHTLGIQQTADAWTLKWGRKARNPSVHAFLLGAAEAGNIPRSPKGRASPVLENSAKVPAKLIAPDHPPPSFWRGDSSVLDDRHRPAPAGTVTCPPGLPEPGAGMAGQSSGDPRSSASPSPRATREHPNRSVSPARLGGVRRWRRLMTHSRRRNCANSRRRGRGRMEWSGWGRGSGQATPSAGGLGAAQSPLRSACVDTLLGSLSWPKCRRPSGADGAGRRPVAWGAGSREPIQPLGESRVFRVDSSLLHRVSFSNVTLQISAL